ncbi:MAG: hypothetical protein IJI07_05555 [Flexilinea sp.]|nr:hypothetical protein [Flexilinea sp.]
MKTSLKSFKFLCVLLQVLFLLVLSAAVSAGAETLDDGVYSAVFTTDSSMFNLCETSEGRGTLTVKDGEMVIHITLSSKNHLHLFRGLAEDAQKEGAELLDPTIDKVVYSDGFADEVHGYDVPVPYLDEDFDLALVGKKGKWYDHKVSVSDPIYVGPLDETALADGTWLCEVTLKGGSGKASVETPAVLTAEGGSVTARIVWSSKYYEYMLVSDVKYDPVNTEGNSAFEIPVVLDSEMPVSASTVAMSQPHLIDYTLFFDSASCAAPAD